MVSANIHAVILAGPQGAGKYTLALMVGRAMTCLNPKQTDGLPDVCGVCENCRRIGEAVDLDARLAEAVEAREGLRETVARQRPAPDDVERIMHAERDAAVRVF